MDERLPVTTGRPTLRGAEWITPSRFGWVVVLTLSVIVAASLLLFPPILVLAAIGGLLGLVLLFYFPFLGVLAYLVFEYARITAMFPVLIPLQFGKLLVAAMVVTWIGNGLVTGRLRFVSDRVNWLMLAWVCVGFITVTVAARYDLAMAGALDLAKWALIYLLLVNLTESHTKWQWFVWTLLLLNLKLSQFQLRSYAYNQSIATTAADADWFIIQGAGAGSTSFLANATDFGAAMCVVVPLAVYLVKFAKLKALRLLGLVSAILFVLSIVRTGSRGAALALFAMALVYWLRSRHKLPVAMGVVGLLVAFWVITPPASKDRFRSAVDYQEDATASGRLDYWKAGIRMFVTHPVTGVGLYNFGHNYEAAGGGYAIVPHSIFIQAASELGVPGISILLALLFLMFKRNHETRRLAVGDDFQARYLRGFADALDLSLVGFIVSGAFLTILYYPHIFVILAMTISLNQIARRQAALTTQESSPAA